MLKTFVPWKDPFGHVEKRLWPMLAGVPHDFTLCGQTALSIRGHLPADGFDLRSSLPVDVRSLEARLPFLAEAKKFQTTPNAIGYELGEPFSVRSHLLFSGDLTVKYVLPPERAKDNGLAVASHLDLAAQTLIGLGEEQSAGTFDGLLILHEALQQGIELAEIFGAARALAPSGFRADDVLGKLRGCDKAPSSSGSPWLEDEVAHAARSMGAVPLLEAYDAQTDWSEILSIFIDKDEARLASELVERVDNFRRVCRELSDWQSGKTQDDYGNVPPSRCARSFPEKMRGAIDQVVDDLVDGNLAVILRGVLNVDRPRVMAELARIGESEDLKIRFVNNADKISFQDVNSLVANSIERDNRLIFLSGSTDRSVAAGLHALAEYSTLPVFDLHNHEEPIHVAADEQKQPLARIDGPEPGSY